MSNGPNQPNPAPYASNGPAAAAYEPPTIGSTRCMIYRHQRILADGCDTCGLSTVACDANDPTCCQQCRHP